MITALVLFVLLHPSPPSFAADLIACDSHNDCSKLSLPHACYFSHAQSTGPSTGFCFEKKTNVPSFLPLIPSLSLVELTQTTIVPTNATTPLPPSASTGPEFGDGTLLLHGDAGKSAALEFSSGANAYSIGNQHGQFVIDHTGQGPVLSATAKGHVSFNVPSVHSRSLFAADTLAVDGFVQWRVVVQDRYSGDSPTGIEGWSSIPLSVPTGLPAPRLPIGVSTDCGVAMLGGPGIFQNAGSIMKTFVLKDVSIAAVRIVGNFHFMDNWSGQSGFMKIVAAKDSTESRNDATGEQQVVWAKQYAIAPRGSESITKKKLSSLNLCGDPTIGEHLFSNKIDVVVPVANGRVTLVFGSTWELQNEGKLPCSWGISGLKLLAR